MAESKSQTESPPRRPKLRKLLVQLGVAVALVATGIGVTWLLIATRPKPKGEAVSASPRLVRVMEAARAPHRCSASAFGTAEASREWTAIAETSGDALKLHPKFEPGEILPKGARLVEIDPEDYRLAQQRYQSEALAREAQLQELKETEANLTEIRDLQKQQLELAKKDLQRIEGLLDEGAVTESAADAARTTHLTRLLAYQETVNQLTLIPVLRARAEADRDAAKTQVEQAKREIEKCSIRLPFDGRCVTKSIEEDQYINVGQRLGTFLSLDTAEVVAMVESRKGASLFPRGIPGVGSIDVTRVLQNDEPLQRALNQLDAEVHWGDPPRRGKVTRIGSTVDPSTRTFPVFIEVDDPYANVTPGVRPPLVPDVFCEVTLYGATVDDVVVLPRDALHEMPRASLSDEFIPVVYLLRGGTRKERDGETYFEWGHLRIQKVEILVEEEDLVVLESGVEPGDLVVLGDLYVPREHWGVRKFAPASEAMPLRGVLQSLPPLHRRGPEWTSDSQGAPAAAADPEVVR